jgi:hypothetical protein
MPPKYKSLILDYCTKQSIAVPAGFGRNTPARYAVIRTDQTPPKLVATTWLKQEDVIYYFEHFLLPQIGIEVAATIPVLDFKEERKFRFTNSNTLEADGSL